MIIFLHGRTGVGKSTVARYLTSQIPNIKSLHSAVIRKELKLEPDKNNSYQYRLDDPVFTKEISPRVYGEMALQAGTFLAKGMNVLLDATYNFKWQRQTIYELADKHQTKVHLIHCICSSEDEVRQRLTSRARDNQSPFAEVNDWETYLSTKNLADPLDEAQNMKNVHLITYDTHASVVSGDQDSCADCRQIADLLKSYKHA